MLRRLLPFLLLLSPVLHAQTKPDTTLRLDLTGSGVPQRVELFTHGEEGADWITSARITADGATIWHIDSTSDSFSPYLIRVAAVKADRKSPRQQLLISGYGNNDFMLFWLLAWDGRSYQVSHLDTWGGEFNWSGDNRFTIDGWIGFCTIRRPYRFEPESGMAVMVEEEQYRITKPITVRLNKALTLTSERGSGDAIRVAKRSRITLQAIDLRGVSQEDDQMMASAWVQIRIADGRIGWARLGKVNDITQLPWAG